MFDWPEATQTCPTSTSEMTMEFLPATVIWNGPGPELLRFNASFHFPLASAVVLADCASSVTVTSSPEAAHPQTEVLSDFCKTMWSEIIAGSRTSAWTG